MSPPLKTGRVLISHSRRYTLTFSLERRDLSEPKLLDKWALLTDFPLDHTAEFGLIPHLTVPHLTPHTHNNTIYWWIIYYVIIHYLSKRLQDTTLFKCHVLYKYGMEGSTLQYSTTQMWVYMSKGPCTRSSKFLYAFFLFVILLAP